jgi:hypothetical protein
VAAVVTADYSPDDGTALPLLCVGKVLLRDQRQARRIASRMAKSKGQRFHAFHCEACRGWHVGRNMGWKT